MAQEISKSCQTVKFNIPLEPFEKAIISQVEKIFDMSNEAAALLANIDIRSAFNDWTWTDHIKELEKEFEEENLQEEYDGDKKHAYEEYMSYMGRKEGGIELARVRRIQAENSSFIETLGERTFKDVEFSPPDEDLASWEIISRIYEFCGRRWKAKSLRNLHGTFEVWKLVHMFTAAWESQKNKTDVLELLFEYDQFSEVYDLEVESDGEGEIGNEGETAFAKPIKLVTRSTKEVEQWPGNLPKSGGDGNITDAYLDYLLRQIGSRKEANDPRGYVHLIPWSELETVKLDQLIAEGIDIEIPFQTNIMEVQWVLWSPPYQGIPWSHPIFTEEQVFGYNVLNTWYFPDHILRGKTIFAVHRLGSTDFLTNLFEYWENWNDCAITQECSGSPLLLLETIPGLRFRSRLKHQDRTASRNYFRNLVDAHATGTLSTSAIRDVLGSENYSAQYEHSLRVIPVEQLSEIDWTTPLGRGENGAVYAATWERPASVLMSSTSSGPVPVVLKEVISRKGQNQAITKKLMKELDSSFTSLMGLSVSCVSFFGITVVDDWILNRERTKGVSSQGTRSQIQGSSRILLVFERATQGTIPQFLEKHFSGIDFIESWDRTADVLSSISVGLKTLHRSQVLHRDLHLNKILVTDRYYPHYVKISHEYQYLLSDLGEGKVLRDEPELNDQTAHHASYGAIDPRAPEVRGNHGWSPAAEVFSYGVIACKILDLRSYFSSGEPPKDILDELEPEFYGISKDPRMISMIVPTGIREAVEPCLSHLPGDRPPIAQVSRIFSQLLTCFTGDRMHPQDEKRVRWTYWDWGMTLRAGRIGTAGKDAEFGGEVEFDEFAEFENVS